MSKIRVLIADDHLDFRRLVHEFLERLPNVQVVGEAADGDETLRQVESLNPDVVLMDIAMPRMSGLDATRVLKQRWPSVRVLIATMHDNPIYRLQAREVKADGFILKSVLKFSLEQEFTALHMLPPGGVPAA